MEHVEKGLPTSVLAQVTERRRDTGEISARVGPMSEQVASR